MLKGQLLIWTPTLLMSKPHCSAEHNTCLVQVRKLLNGNTLFALINNAGAAFHGPLMYQPIEEFRKNIEINLIGTLQVTQVRQH